MLVQIIPIQVSAPSSSATKRKKLDAQLGQTVAVRVQWFNEQVIRELNDYSLWVLGNQCSRELQRI